MKLKTLLLASLALVGLSACSDNTTESLENGEEKAYDTYLTVNFSSPNNKPFSRTVGPADDKTTDGTTINNAHIYLVNNKGKIVKAASSKVTSNKSESIKVEEGKYRVFVVINPSTLTPIKSEGDDIIGSIKGITEANAKAGLDNGTFLMSSAVNVDKMEEAGVPISITAANSVNNPANVDAKVDRMAVKIQYDAPAAGTKIIGDLLATKDSQGNPLFTEKLGAEALKGFVLVNGNQNANLFQSWHTSTTDPIGFYMNTPQGAEDKGVVTGYYNPISSFAKVEINEEAKEVLSIENAKIATFSLDPIFTVENRPKFVTNTKLTAGKAQTTGVIFNIVFGDGKTTYYYFDGVMYTDLKEVEKNDAFKGDTLTGLPVGKLRAKGIKVYENGQMYYTYFIIDQNNKVNYKGIDTMYYAVHRNSVYKLTIDELSRVGDDVPGGGDVTPINPNPDIDPDNVYLKVGVKVNPWVLNTNNIRL